jgi:hypothetical protein
MQKREEVRVRQDGTWNALPTLHRAHLCFLLNYDIKNLVPFILDICQ